jgi:hypothetical protein
MCCHKCNPDEAFAAGLPAAERKDDRIRPDLFAER